MIEIHIRKLIGENCISYEDASILYNEIFPLIKENKQITLNFSETNVISSPFFNGSLGKLLKDFQRNELRELIQLVHLPSYAAQTLKIVLDNAELFYNDKNDNEKLNQVLFD